MPTVLPPPEVFGPPGYWFCQPALSPIEALRSVNQVAHFTHFTVAHAHLGAYAFVTMVLFGAIYFMLPRVLNWEWPYPRLISLQFWLAAIGILIYFVGLSIGGWLQGHFEAVGHRATVDLAQLFG